MLFYDEFILCNAVLLQMQPFMILDRVGRLPFPLLALVWFLVSN